MPELTAAVLAWRVQRITEMGFDHEKAVEMAEARDSAGHLLDLHRLERMLAQGCERDTAYAICA